MGTFTNTFTKGLVQQGTGLKQNSAPSDITLSVTSIAENNEIGDVIGALSTTDPNSGNTFTYTLVSGTGSTDNTSFTIDGASLKAGISFDYETKSSYSIRVRSTDQDGLSTEKEFTITITDVLEFDSLAPSNMTLTVISDTSVKIDWTVESTNRDGHKIEFGTTGLGYTEAATVNGETATCTVSGLTAGTTYYFRVRAYKATVYSAYSNIKSILPSVNQNLLAYWKMDESSGNAQDSIGSYHLTNNNAVSFVTGKLNNGVDFGSANTNKFLNHDSNFGMTYASPRSISLWVNINAQPADGSFFCLASLIFAANPGNYTDITYRNEGGVYKIYSTGQNIATKTLTTGTWYNIIVTHDHTGNIIKFYIDSVYVGQYASFTGNYSAQTSSFKVGKFLTIWLASAKLDEVALWNRVLTQTEINYIFNSGKAISTPFDKDVINYNIALGSTSYCWFARPKALYDATSNKTFIGQVHNNGTGYSQTVVTIDNATGVVTPTKVGTVVQYDDHNEPSILVKVDGKLFTAYTEHAVPIIRWRTSTNNLDGTTWGAESTIVPIASHQFTYPSCFQVANGDIYIFFRDQTATTTSWSFIKSVDNGATFSGYTKYSNDNGSSGTKSIYQNIIQDKNNKNLIHFVESYTAVEQPSPNRVSHFYFNAENATWHKSDGTDVTANLPLDLSNQTTIITKNNPEQTWIEDIFLDASGYPRVLFAYYPNVVTTPILKYLYYSEWNGSAWSTPYEIHQSNNKNMCQVVGSATYMPLSCFDRGNANRIFAAKEVSGITEIFEITRVSASSFTSVQKTFNSTYDQWRPFTVESSKNNVFWLNKIRYYWYADDYNQELVCASY